jgi:hypothetical protein
MRAIQAYSSDSPLSTSQFPASVTAEHAWSRVSSKYAFLPTMQVVTALGDVGLYPYMVKQSGTRIEGKDGYTKHLIRFRSEGVKPLKGNVYPEVVLVNSHDRASSFSLELGLFRLVCSNGLVVSFGNFGAYRVRHVASIISDVLVGAEAIVRQFPMIEESVARMQAYTLSDNQRSEFAYAAMGLRWSSDKAPFESDRLLQTRRADDTGRDLWTTYNVIQENLLRGQNMRFRRRFYGSQVPRTTREVKSIDMEMSLNRGLWELAAGYATA